MRFPAGGDDVGRRPGHRGRFAAVRREHDDPAALGVEVDRRAEIGGQGSVAVERGVPGERIEHDPAFVGRLRKAVVAVDDDARCMRVERDRAREARRTDDEVGRIERRRHDGVRTALRDRCVDVAIERAGRIRARPFADAIGARRGRRRADVVAQRAGRIERVRVGREVLEDRTARAAVGDQDHPHAIVLQHDVRAAVGEDVGVPRTRFIGRHGLHAGERHDGVR
ncbi:MAG: hypothetical protein ABR975_07905 [Vulcanimicrobiaceae bacterium]